MFAQSKRHRWENDPADYDYISLYSRPTKTDPTGISCIVPFASHIDQTEHDLDVAVTEQGLADLHGLSPCERAPVIIEKCAHPDHKDLLREYYDRSSHECLKRGAGHEPHMLRIQPTALSRTLLSFSSASSPPFGKP
ncbi:acetyl-CoA hydrolase [Stygiomarasmius scandens]|uniref:Acetyl-CoA hydrolase n=1 Tax=Marasmiellus scandens TaxID=2682957 RepID=A0ABR1J4N0_9AGAR